MQKKTHAVNPFYCGLTVYRHTEYSKKLTKCLRAALITDLHSTIYDSAQEPIPKALQSYRPDLVLMAGDIADHKVPHKRTLLLLEGLKGQYPCYYVTGNHERWIHQTPDIKKMSAGYGVTVSGGQTIRTAIKGQSLITGGVDDPHAFTDSHHSIELDSRWKEQFWRCCSRTSPAVYSILPSHWSELTKYYRDSEFDLTVAGHAHGGRVRTSGCSSGFLTPYQGFFPWYARGQYALGATSLIISRGLCTNRPLRIYNPPKLALVDLGPILQSVPSSLYALPGGPQMGLVLL